LRVHVVFVPTSRDRLQAALLEGRGDIVAANITVTPGRQDLAEFVTPTFSDVKELVVTGPGARRAVAEEFGPSSRSERAERKAGQSP